jgi:hypothetical protein
VAFTRAMTAPAQAPEALADPLEDRHGDQRGIGQPECRHHEVAYSTR